MCGGVALCYILLIEIQYNNHIHYTISYLDGETDIDWELVEVEAGMLILTFLSAYKYSSKFSNHGNNNMIPKIS